MKKIIAIAAMVASTQSFAFFNSGNGYNNNAGGDHNGQAQMNGNGSGDAEASFSMSFKARGSMKSDFDAKGSNASNGSAWGYNTPYYGQPVAPVAKPEAKNQ